MGNGLETRVREEECVVGSVQGLSRISSRMPKLPLEMGLEGCERGGIVYMLGEDVAGPGGSQGERL